MKKLSLTLLLWLGAAGVALAQSVNLPFNAPTTNGSVVIATGNTFQTVLAAVTNPANNPSARHSLTIQNNNANDNCWLFIGSATATAGKSILLSSGQAYTRYYPYIPSDVIQATCATTSDTLYVDYQ